MKGRADDAGPNGPVIQPSELIEAVLGLLENAGVPTEINDKVVKLIETWEYEQENTTTDEPTWLIQGEPEL